MEHVVKWFRVCCGLTFIYMLFHYPLQILLIEAHVVVFVLYRYIKSMNTTFSKTIYHAFVNQAPKQTNTTINTTEQQQWIQKQLIPIIKYFQMKSDS